MTRSAIALAPHSPVASVVRALQSGKQHPLWYVSKAERLAACQASLRTFCAVYFGARDGQPSRFEDDPPAFHEELFQLADALDADPDLDGAVIAAPRGHAKTTILGFALPLHRIVFQRKRFIVILQDTLDQARLAVENIRRELEENHLLHEDFGSFVGDTRWTIGDIVTRQGVRVYARSTGAKVRGLNYAGRRPDLIIADDLENDEHVRTPEQRQKTADWWHRAVYNMGSKDCKIIVIGTILHPAGLLAQLLQPRPHWVTRVYRALEGDRVLWPARYPRERLERIRAEIGSLAFQAEYQNEPLGEADRVFQPAWWRWYTRDDVAYDHARQQWTFRGVPLTIVQGVDPAISEADQADEFAHVTLGVTPTGDVLLLWAHVARCGFPEQVQLVHQEYWSWRPRRIGLEVVAYQRALKQEVLRRSALPLPIRGLANARVHKRLRIARRSLLVENGKVWLRAALPDEPGYVHPALGAVRIYAGGAPAGQPQAAPFVRFFAQATDYPLAAHDDLLDAFDCALQVVQDGPMWFEERF